MDRSTKIGLKAEWISDRVQQPRCEGGAARRLEAGWGGGMDGKKICSM